MKKLTKISMTLCALVLLAFLPASSGQEKQGQGPDAQAQKGNKKVVYVCACLKNRSCACMTEAKTEGPCACGTEGGPPMTAVPKDSDWAKENRKALEK
jgi:hypothetical protein